jgi:hypothetical protein
VTAPFHDPRPPGDELNVWPPLAERSAEMVSAYMAQARHMRIEAIRVAVLGIVAAVRKFLRR